MIINKQKKLMFIYKICDFEEHFLQFNLGSTIMQRNVQTFRSVQPVFSFVL